MGTNPADDAVSRLVDKNSKLYGQIEVHRSRIHALESRLAQLEVHDAEHAETVLCIRRMWDELNEAIDFLKYCVRGTRPALDGPEGSGSGSSIVTGASPFLATVASAFLSAKDLASAGLEPGPVPDLEVELRRRSAATLQAAGVLLQEVNGLQQRFRGAGAGGGAGGGGSGVAAADDEPAGDVASAEPMDTDVAAERRTGDDGNEQPSPAPPARPINGGSDPGTVHLEKKLVALNVLLKSENRRLQDAADAAAARQHDLETALADREAELLVARRKAAQPAAVHGADSAPHPDRPCSPDSVGGRPSGTTTAATTAGGPSPSPPPPPPAEESEAAELSAANAELQERLGRVEKELESRAAALAAATRDARAAREALDLERDGMARARQHDLQQARRLEAELGEADAALRALRSERDHLARRCAEAQTAMDAAAHAARRAQLAEDDVRLMERRLAAAQAAREEAESLLGAERAKAGSQPTVQALQDLLSAAKRDLGAQQTTVARLRVRLAEMQQAADSTNAAVSMAEETHASELGELRRKFAEEEAAWKEREADLVLFMELAREYAGAGARNEESAARDHARELRSRVIQLERRVEELVAQLEDARAGTPAPDSNGHAAPAGTTTPDTSLPTDQAALKDANSASAARTIARLERELATTRNRLSSSQDECEACLAELESVAAAYEEAQAQASRLAELAQRADDQRGTLLTELMAAQRERATARENAAASEERLRIAAAAAAEGRTRCAELEASVAGLGAESAALRQEAGEARSALTAARRAVEERDVALATASADVEALRSALTARSSERDAAVEAAAAAEARATAAEQSAAAVAERQAAVATAAAALTNTGGINADEDVAGLKAEVAALRDMVNCSVCHARRKSVVLTKCFHMFCGACIKRNLESRHRKCPGCGTGFGANDVAQFFFT